jgi:hypothetical protein
MSKAFNIGSARIDISAIAGDTIDMSFSVAFNGVAYDMTGMQLDMKIVYELSGITERTLSSAGTSPALTISTSTFNILTTPFINPGVYKYDLQLTNGTVVSTIGGGDIEILPQIT